MLNGPYELIAWAFFLLVLLCALVIYQSCVIEKLEGRVDYYRGAYERAQRAWRRAVEKPRGKVVKLSEAENRRRTG